MGNFEPDNFEDQNETALVDLINQKRAGKPITWATKVDVFSSTEDIMNTMAMGNT